MFSASMKRVSFLGVMAALLVTLPFATWISHMQVEARAASAADSRSFAAIPVGKPLQQCTSGPDLQIQSITVEPNPPGVDQPFNVRVTIVNQGVITGTTDTWAYLYVDKAPVVTTPPDVQAFSPTNGLDFGQTAEAIFTVPGSLATAGYHSIAIYIDAVSPGVNESSCGGEGNNTGATSVQIEAVFTPTPTSTSTPTLTPVPTPTSFPLPQIYFFTGSPTTVVRGNSTTLSWQVYGQSVSVYLDGESVAMEQAIEITPDGNHVYTLRAQNPGGTVEKTISITVVDPTSTPTLTPTSCPLAVINQFGATSTSILRGGKVTVYWDLSGATEAYLNDDGVPGVSQREFTLKQTTVFTLRAHNACGDVEKSLTVNVLFATPSPTPSPTSTRTPTSTPTATFTPSKTPTRNVITPAPTSTATSGPTSAFTPTPTGVTGEQTSPLPAPTETLAETPAVEATATETATVMPTMATTDTPIPTSTFTPPPTVAVQATPSPTAGSTLAAGPTRIIHGTSPLEAPTATTIVQIVQTAISQTATTQAAAAAQTVTPPAGPATTKNTIRMYLCPLFVLLVFSIGVIVLSLVLPRLRERREAKPAYDPTANSALEGSLLGEPASSGGPPPGNGSPGVVPFLDGEIVEEEADEVVVKVQPEPLSDADASLLS